MQRILRFGLHIVTILAGVLSGCGSSILGPDNYVTPTYGIEPPEHDPTVVITDFSYTPESPVTAGERPVFRVELNKPIIVDAAFVLVYRGEDSTADPYAITNQLSTLNDIGYEDDEIAGDGIWTGRLRPEFAYTPIEDLPVFARVEWYDGYIGPGLSGPPLTIVPVNEEE